MIADIKKDLAELAIPRYARRIEPLYRAWMVLAFTLGWFVLRALLILLYAILILPMGLLYALVGRDPLRRARVPRTASYWITVPVREKTYRKKF